MGAQSRRVATAALRFCLLGGHREAHYHKGGVFTDDLLEMWIDYKMENEVLGLRLRPHPHEFFLYYDC